MFMRLFTIAVIAALSTVQAIHLDAQPSTKVPKGTGVKKATRKNAITSATSDRKGLERSDSEYDKILEDIDNDVSSDEEEWEFHTPTRVRGGAARGSLDDVADPETNIPPP